MKNTVKDLIAFQKEFDRQHAGKLPFYVDIDEGNLEELEHLLVCLMGEVGEFSNLVKKVRRGDFPLGQVKSELDEELVDVFVYLLKIAGQFKVDLELGYDSKMKKNAEKFQRYKL